MIQEIVNQIMGKRVLRFEALLGECDRGCLNSSNPDGQATSSLNLFQEHDGLIGRHLDTNADYLNLNQHE
jgi:hypothetical protein